MRLYDLALYITRHAHEQYCKRVEDLTRQDLTDRVQHQIDQRDYSKSGDFVHIAGVWWVAEIDELNIRLITCYGLTHIDIPAALAWAARHKDRLVLSDGDKA